MCLLRTAAWVLGGVPLQEDDGAGFQRGPGGELQPPHPGMDGEAGVPRAASRVVLE